MSEINEHRQDVAIALNYDGQNAPRITAKGENELARRILEAADEAEIPLKYDPELAAILSQIPLGDEIPENLYRAIAEVIAFAYFIAGKTPEGWQPHKPRQQENNSEVSDETTDNSTTINDEFDDQNVSNGTKAANTSQDDLSDERPDEQPDERSD